MVSATAGEGPFRREYTPAQKVGAALAVLVVLIALCLWFVMTRPAKSVTPQSSTHVVVKGSEMPTAGQPTPVIPASAVPGKSESVANACITPTELKQAISDACEPKKANPQPVATPLKVRKQQPKVPPSTAVVAPPKAAAPPAKVQVTTVPFNDRCYLEAGAAARLKSDPTKVLAPDTVIAETRHSSLLMEGTSCKEWAARKTVELLWKPKEFKLEQKDCERLWNDGRVEKRSGLSYEACKNFQSVAERSVTGEVSVTVGEVSVETRVPIPVAQITDLSKASLQSTCTRTWSDGRTEVRRGYTSVQCDAFKAGTTN